jgi:hypothetical protein
MERTLGIGVLVNWISPSAQDEGKLPQRGIHDYFSQQQNDIEK